MALRCNNDGRKQAAYAHIHIPTRFLLCGLAACHLHLLMLLLLIMLLQRISFAKHVFDMTLSRRSNVK